MAKRKGKKNPSTKVYVERVKKTVADKARTFVRGIKGAAMAGTKTAYRRARRLDPKLTRKAFLATV